MVGALKTLLSAGIMIAGFTVVVSVLGNGWPVWVLMLSGLLGGNVIITLSTLAFAKEWWV